METKSALIVIPTTGSTTLAPALDTALNQTYADTEVWVIIDGPQFLEKAAAILSRYPTVKYMCLPSNTGKSKHGDFYGHRIYAAVSFLFDHDYIFYLDQDNGLDNVHVETMINACEKNGWDWCYSLRQIFHADGTYVCDDDCESLGKWPVYVSDQHHLVDTSSYCIKRNVITRIASAWYSGWGGDRVFYSAISTHFPNFGCSKQSTVFYRLDGNETSVNSDFFINGNRIMNERHPGGYPWRM